jgi:GNAT superfamily N-acetyltransferase
VAELDLRDGDMVTEPGRTLVTELWDDMAIRYADDETAPETKGETDDLRNEEVLPPDGRFVIVFDGDDPVACGAIRRHDAESAEIKRMWVRPGARGRGLARLVLRELEATAAARGYRALVLETGLRQPEAIALYESHGYTTVPNFGFYKESALSVCYRKELDGTPGVPSGASRRAGGGGSG